MAAQNTFEELIIERGFDRYQPGLEARFRAHRLGYKLHYGEPTSKASLWMDFSTDEAVARVTLWVSGECDMEVIDCVTGKDLLRETHDFASSDDFFSTYPKVPLLLESIRQVKS